jgi:acetoin utilization deacetylase AcuC-like enzyme
MKRLSCAGYAGLIASLKGLAQELCEGRIVVALEGGYDLTALSWSIRNSMEALLGEAITPDPVRPAPDAPAPDLDELHTQLRSLHAL